MKNTIENALIAMTLLGDTFDRVDESVLTPKEKKLFHDAMGEGIVTAALSLLQQYYPENFEKEILH